jgi:hypothetical protein
MLFKKSNQDFRYLSKFGDRGEVILALNQSEIPLKNLLAQAFTNPFALAQIHH